MSDYTSVEVFKLSIFEYSQFVVEIFGGRGNIFNICSVGSITITTDWCLYESCYILLSFEIIRTVLEKIVLSPEAKEGKILTNLEIWNFPIFLIFWLQILLKTWKILPNIFTSSIPIRINQIINCILHFVCLLTIENTFFSIFAHFVWGRGIYFNCQENLEQWSL